MNLLFFVLVAAFVAQTAHSALLHVVITTQPKEGASTDAATDFYAVQRRVFMSDEREMLDFTNDDANVMLDCRMTKDATAIRGAIIQRRAPHDEQDVIDTRVTYDDDEGATFAAWKRACAQVQKRTSAPLWKRKVFPEIVYPGTKWCGPGDDAEDYEDLGSLIHADKCCRAHDNCPEDILPFQTKYHYFNYRPWTVTHCTCDENLFNCLKTVTRKNPEESTDANRIGDVFFREVNPPCFRLEPGRYCVKRHWSQLWCAQWESSEEVATIRSYLAEEWDKVNNTIYIPNKPPLQPIK